MKSAMQNDIPATASHEISGIYGLEIRTLTAAINASVLPKTFEVANFVEKAMQGTGVTAPLMIMKGDGGVTDMNTFRTKPNQFEQQPTSNNFNSADKIKISSLCNAFVEYKFNCRRCFVLFFLSSFNAVD